MEKTHGIAFAPPSIAKTPHDHLELPGGRWLGKTPDGELFGLLSSLNIPGVAAENGRSVNAAFYAAHLDRLRNEGAAVAVNAFLSPGRAS